MGPSITCNREDGVEAAVSVRQMQPVTHLDLMSLAPGKVHQGATNVAAQLEHFPVDVKILAIATACRGRDTPLVTHWGKKDASSLIKQKKKPQNNSKCTSNFNVRQRTLTNVSDDAPRFRVQQELSHFRPGSVAAVIEIRGNLVIDAVDVVSLELTGSLFHHV